VEVIAERWEDRLETLMMLVSELEADESQQFLTAAGGGADEAPAESAPSVDAGSQGKGWNGQPRSRAGLRVAVANWAANNHAVLRAMLVDVSQSVREALLKAIAISEDGYAKVLAALE
jgi:hypothetical protein